MKNIDEIVRHDTLAGSRWLNSLLPAAAVAGVVAAHALIFLLAPDERVMGPVQKIFYFHVGSALAAYLMVFTLFVGSCAFLATRRRGWDVLCAASSRVALLFCTVVLATGMIWGHAAWNVWWRWEPRLVSFLVLWLIVFAYVLLRVFTDDHQRGASFAAVVGAAAGANVPLVVYSVKLMNKAAQLHPQVIGGGGLGDPRFVYALIAGATAVMLIALWLFALELQNETLRAALNRAARRETGER